MLVWQWIWPNTLLRIFFPNNISAIMSRVCFLISCFESELESLFWINGFWNSFQFSLIPSEYSLAHWSVCSGFSQPWLDLFIRQKEHWMTWILTYNVEKRWSSSLLCKQTVKDSILQVKTIYVYIHNSILKKSSL